MALEDGETRASYRDEVCEDSGSGRILQRVCMLVHAVYVEDAFAQERVVPSCLHVPDGDVVFLQYTTKRLLRTVLNHRQSIIIIITHLFIRVYIIVVVIMYLSRC